MNKAYYYIVFGLWYLLSLLPFRVLYFISDGLYAIVYYLVGYRRQVVRQNLVSSFPQKTLKEVIEIEKKFYRFFCDYLVETLKLFSISEKEMKKRMVFKGLDVLDEAFFEEGRNFCFLYMGHYCNWEWIASLPYHTHPDVLCAQIYHPLYSKVFDKLFLRVRNHFGGESIPMKNTLRRIVDLKRKNQKTVIGFISDQLPKWNSIHFFTPFLHHDTAVFTGTEQIGRQMNALFLFGEVERPRRGYYVCTFRKMKLSEQQTTDYEATALFMRMLEDCIRKKPEFWLWSHKRWKRTKEQWEKRQQQKSKENS